MSLTIKLSGKIIFALAAALVLISGFSRFIPAGRAQVSEQKGVPPSKYAATVEMLDAFISREMEDKKLPDMAIALVDGQHI